MVRPSALTRLFVLVVTVSIAGCGSSASNLQTNSAKIEPALASPSGWKEAKTSGIALSFPPDWKAIDVTAPDAGQDIQNVFGNDAQSKAIANQTAQMAKAGVLKLFILAPRVHGAATATNCNVISNDLPQDIGLEQLVQLNADQLKTLAQGGKVDTTYVDAPGGKIARLSAKLNVTTPGGVNSTMFIALQGRKIAVVTFTADDASKAATDKIADQSIKTFRFEKA